MSTAFDHALTQIDTAAALLSPSYLNQKQFTAAINKLKTINHLHHGQLEITMDNGQKKQFACYRSQHNNTLGPYKGGLRFHPQVCEAEVKALSVWMSWKSAIIGLPYGGGKGGITVNPKDLSAAELERLSRAFARFLAPHIGPWIDIPAPDVNTNGQIMAWMIDELSQIRIGEGRVSENYLANLTGKPLALGGSQGRDEATGLGGLYVLQAYAEKTALKPEQTKIAIQGFGNVGSWFAHHAQANGFKVVALSDSSGTIYNEAGIDIPAIITIKKKAGNFATAIKKDLLQAQLLPATDILYLPVDVLAPAALEDVITSDNYQKIQAKLIFELANGPVTPEAEILLQQNNIIVVPDVLANAGGVSTSYFEWVQNLQGYYWSHQEVLAKLEPLMKNALSQVHAMHLNHPEQTYRQAAYLIALKNIIDTMILRGQV